MFESLRAGLWLTPARLRTYPLILLALFGIAFSLLIASSQDGVDRLGHRLGTDFTEIWAAGREVRDGHPEQAYDIAIHRQMQTELFGSSPDFYLWSYPPYFLGVAAILAALPYLGALAVWQATTLSLYLAVVLSILRSAGVTTGQALIATLAFPAVFINLIHGQNGFLTAALLTGGILCLRRRPYLAGILFACLIYKPQFALMVPIALLAGGYWWTILAGVLTLILLTLVTLALFGVEVWLAFPEAISASKSLVLEDGGAGFEKMQSLFAAARLLGATVHEAYLLQFILVGVLLCALAWLWHSSADARLKGAALLTATLLATPYCFDYDMVLLAPALAMAVSYGLENGFRPYEKSLFACVWICPLLARPLAIATAVPIGAFVTGLLFFTLMVRARPRMIWPSVALRWSKLKLIGQ